MDSRRPDWSALYLLDSDGDGQTNGQELGDPCGTWVRGEPAPREADISNPTDETVVSADPASPACDETDASDVTDPSDETDASDDTEPSDQTDSTTSDEGGCRAIGPNAVWLLAALTLRRKRKSKLKT